MTEQDRLRFETGASQIFRATTESLQLSAFSDEQVVSLQSFAVYEQPRLKRAQGIKHVVGDLEETRLKSRRNKAHRQKPSRYGHIYYH